MKGLYKFIGDCGRHGCLYGMFIAQEDDVKKLLESKMELYFGEVLGKHSDICYIVGKRDFTLISDNPDLISLCEQNNIQIGFNPVEMWKEQIGE